MTRASSRAEMYDVLRHPALKLSDTEVQVFEDLVDHVGLNAFSLRRKRQQDHADRIFSLEVRLQCF